MTAETKTPSRFTRRHAGIAGIAAVLVAIVLLVGFSGSQSDYRLAGLRMIQGGEQAQAAQKAGQSRFSGPQFPGQVALTLTARSMFSEADPFAAIARSNTVLMAAAGAFTVVTAAMLAGWLAALAAALVFLLLPGSLYFAQNAGPEALIAFFWSALMLVGTLRWRGAIGAALATAALAGALVTTHEAAWLVVTWLLALPFLGARKAAGPPGLVGVSAVPFAHLVPVLAAPAVAIAIWPFLGEDLGKHLVEVVYGPLKAQHPPILIGHTVHDQATARGPGFDDGLLVILLRTPLVVTIAAAFGVFRALRSAAGTPLRHALFPALMLGALLLIIALNGSPYYADTDTLAPLAPLLAVFAGLGVAAVLTAVGEQLPGRAPIAVAAAILLLPALVDRAAAWGDEPSYHNALAGFAEGAADAGFELRPAASVPVDLVAWMNQHLPQRAAVAIDPAGERYRELLDGLTRAKLLRADIQTAAPYHGTHLLVPEHPAYPLFTDRIATTGPAVATVEVSGVRLMTLYAY